MHNDHGASETQQGLVRFARLHSVYKEHSDVMEVLADMAKSGLDRQTSPSRSSLAP